MVVIISTNPVYSLLEQMNRTGRYDFYRVKADTSDGITSELEMLSGFSHVIYDMNVLPYEQSKEVLEPLCYKNIDIIVIASGMNPYDVVVQDFYGFGISDVFTESGDILMKNINEALINSDAHIEDNVSDITNASAKTKTETVPNIAAAQDIAKTSLIDTGRIHKASTIAFAGAGPRIGTTTQVFQTALYLKSMFAKVAIVDIPGSSWINYTSDQAIKQVAEDEYIVYGIPYFTSQHTIAKLRIEFEYLVYDYGTFASISDLMAFTEKDTHVVVCGYKPMENIHLMPVFETKCESILYLFSFVPEELKAAVTASMVEYGSNSFFAGYSPDIFKYAGNDKLYQMLTQDNSLAGQQVKQKNPGFFGGLLRKKVSL